MEPQMYASKQLPIYDSIIIKSIIALLTHPFLFLISINHYSYIYIYLP